MLDGCADSASERVSELEPDALSLSEPVAVAERRDQGAHGEPDPGAQHADLGAVAEPHTV